jgi:hypothetical protein
VLPPCLFSQWGWGRRRSRFIFLTLVFVRRKPLRAAVFSPTSEPQRFLCSYVDLAHARN